MENYIWQAAKFQFHNKEIVQAIWDYVSQIFKNYDIYTPGVEDDFFKYVRYSITDYVQIRNPKPLNLPQVLRVIIGLCVSNKNYNLCPLNETIAGLRYWYKKYALKYFPGNN